MVIREDEHPHIRQVGRYLAYLFLAFNTAMVISAFVDIAGLKRDFSTQLIGPIAIVIFLYLRDMEKNAEIRGRRQADKQQD